MSREIKGITIILTAYLLGEVISLLIGRFMPGSIIGMILLFIALQCGVVDEEDIKGVCNFVLNNMMMLFVPVTAGLMISYKLISDNLVSSLSVMVISTILVLVIVGYVQQYLGRRWRR